MTRCGGRRHGVASRPLVEHLREEHLATVAGWVAQSPLEARRWCLVSRTFAATFRRFGLWARALESVRWPPAAKAGRALVLDAYARLGGYCRCISVDGWRSGDEDLLTLARLCQEVHSVEVTGIGVRGVDAEVWRIWSGALRRARLSFFYDAVDGAPALREVLADIVTHCALLEDLTVAGMDYNNAREACLEVLCHQPGNACGLRRVELVGCEAQLNDHALAALKRARPALRVHISKQVAPNLDW